MNKNEFADKFADATIEELIDTFNRQVGNLGWGSTRAQHDSALREEFLRRHLDCSSFITESSICFREPIKLAGDRIVQDPSIDVYVEPVNLPPERTVVIGRVPSCDKGDCFVAILESEARDLATKYDAIESAKNWRDFRHAVGVRLWHFCKEHLSENDVVLPRDDDPFDPMIIPGFEDGDWPACPRQCASDWLPASALRLAKRYDTSTGGELIEFEVKDVPSLLAVLEAEGFLTIRQDDLAWKACGFDSRESDA